jgi:predicted nucleic acid-binding protein
MEAVHVSDRVPRNFGYYHDDTACGAQLKHVAKVRSNEDVPMADSLIAATSIICKATCITDSPHFDTIPPVNGYDSQAGAM